MTDDEINDLIIEHYATSGEINDVVAFARAIADIEREACAKICDRFQPRAIEAKLKEKNYG